MQYIEERSGGADAARKMHDDRQAKKIDYYLRPDVNGWGVIFCSRTEIQGIDIENIGNGQYGRHGHRPPLLLGDANGGERVGGDKRKYLKKNEQCDYRPAKDDKPPRIAD